MFLKTRTQIENPKNPTISNLPLVIGNEVTQHMKLSGYRTKGYFTTKNAFLALLLLHLLDSSLLAVVGHT